MVTPNGEDLNLHWAYFMFKQIQKVYWKIAFMYAVIVLIN